MRPYTNGSQVTFACRPMTGVARSLNTTTLSDSFSPPTSLQPSTKPSRPSLHHELPRRLTTCRAHTTVAVVRLTATLVPTSSESGNGVDRRRDCSSTSAGYYRAQPRLIYSRAIVVARRTPAPQRLPSRARCNRCRLVVVSRRTIF